MAMRQPRQIDHVTLNVQDLEVARTFYRAALAELGLGESVDPRGRAEYGADGRFDFGFYADPSTAFQRPHVAFSAASRDEVDRFYAAALAHGGSSLDPPRERPEFGRYSAYVAAPDGMGVEVTCPLDERGSTAGSG
jgi:catechol 2,3-dioxygenase-like lactoylglutathione lyase family enzyme